MARPERIFDVSIEGAQPGLLQHRFDPTAQMGASRRTKASQYDPDEWRKGLYMEEDGHIYQPAVAIEQALIRAGYNFKMKGQKTWGNWVESSVFIQPDKLMHSVTLEDFEKAAANGGSYEAAHIFTTRAVIASGRKKNSIIRVRPLLYPWELDLQLVVLDEACPDETLRDIMEFAGRFVGVGDWRPRYGRFDVVKFEAQ